VAHGNTNGPAPNCNNIPHINQHNFLYKYTQPNILCGALPCTPSTGSNPPTGACGSAASTKNFIQGDSGQNFVINGTVAINGQVTNPVITWNGSTLGNSFITPTVTLNGTYTTQSGIHFTTSNIINNSSSLTAGTYSITYTISGGNIPDNLSNSIKCTAILTVSTEPYISVNGGDVAVGSVISSTSGNCTDPKGLNTGNGLGDGILTFNKNTLPFTGSGTNMAVQALYYIDGFVSNQNYPASINKLTLANRPIQNNTGSPIPVGSSSIFGGIFGEAPCPPDITIPISLNAKILPNITTSSLPTENTLYTGPLTIQAYSTDKYTGQATIYVNGDVYIKGVQLNYSTNGWNSLSDIPSLRIVATGDIYIDPTITSLDGTYIAQGNIYDCAVYPSKNYGGPQCYSNNLTVNGSFMANAIYLQRTGGDTNTTGTAAETFNYGPEDWLAPAGNKRGTLTKLVSLPPVL
jgi:hypothetical protein